MKKVERIATVKATGKRFVVQQLDLRQDVCHCWGNLRSYEFKRGVLVKHAYDPPVAFPLKDVSIRETTITEVVLDELFEQSKLDHADDLATGKMTLHEPKRRRKAAL